MKIYIIRYTILEIIRQLQLLTVGPMKPASLASPLKPIVVLTALLNDGVIDEVKARIEWSLLNQPSKRLLLLGVLW